MDPLSISLIVIGRVVIVGIFYLLYRIAKYGAILGI